MSRSNVAKSRADKSIKPSAPTPAVTHEIVPGKFNNNDWNFMLDHDEGDDFVFGIVEETVNTSLDIIYDNYIQRQLVPFTVTQAKDALLQIVEWQFLSNDEGDGSSAEADAGWMQDEEPSSSVPDCWAQGSVPRQYIAPPTPTIIEEEAEEAEIPQTTLEEDIRVENLEETTGEEQQDAEEEGAREDSLPVEESTVEAEEQQEQHMQQAEVADRPNKKTKKQSTYKPKKGKLCSAGLSRMTESLEETEIRMNSMTQIQPERSVDPDQMQMPVSCQSLLKLQGGRPPGSREVQYDDKGNVVNMVKIDPDSLPSHYVRTKYTVVDPAIEAAQAHLQAMRTGKYVGSARRKAMQASPRLPRTRSPSKPGAAASLKKGSISTTSQDKGPISPLPPPLIESMDVMPGVVVREGGRVKAGPKYVSKRDISAVKTTSKLLRPVCFKTNMPVIAVAEILDRQTPIIKPLQGEMPIPPILPHPPSQPIGSR